MICDAADAAVYANSSAWTALNTGCGNFCGVKMFAGPACATQCFSSSNSFGNTLSADCADCTGQQSYCVVQNCVLGGASVCILDSSSPGCASCSDAACLDAFLNCSGLPARALPAPAPMCNATDAAVYANSSAWTALVTSCGNTCGQEVLDPGSSCAAACFSYSLSADCAECAGKQTHCVATNCLAKCAADSTTPGCVACADAACLGAFLECSGINAPSRSLPPSPSPSNSLSAGCAGCAGQQSYCVTTNCLGECGTDSSTPGCVTCAQATCLDAFFSCSGLSHRVPTPPSPPSPPSLPPPPSVVVELKVTGTFEEFRKPSVVEDIKTKLASASGVDAAYVTITVRDASGNLISESQGSAFSGSRRLSESFEFSISMIIAIPLGKTVEEVLTETNTALASPAIATATLGRAVSAIEVLVGAPPSAPPPTPSPPPSDLLDPPFGSSNSTFACSDADSKLYANTSVWVGFSLECGLGCGVGAMLANPNCAAACLREKLSLGCADCTRRLGTALVLRPLPC